MASGCTLHSVAVGGGVGQGSDDAWRFVAFAAYEHLLACTQIDAVGGWSYLADTVFAVAGESWLRYVGDYDARLSGEALDSSELRESVASGCGDKECSFGAEIAEGNVLPC